MKVSKIGAIGHDSYAQRSEQREKKGSVERAQIKELSNICYRPLSFGRTWAEHKSWGAVIDPKTKEASFKIFTYPDTERITVTVEKSDNKSKEYELENKGNGIFEIDKIKAGEVEHGDKYFYTLYKPNQDPVQVKDPYSFRQEQLMNKSTVYDHSLYKWKDEDWYKSNKRISRLANPQNGLTPLNKAKIYEFNTATLTQDGTFKAAKKELDKIQKLGFNAIEIMPVENTYSFNWGYDGVDKLAPSEHLGGPDQLKDFIDHAHQKGLNVIMDMVPNHIGPDGSQLRPVGPYIDTDPKRERPFGDVFNFEGDNSRYVKDYIVNASLNWLDNYHCDGIRFDMTKFMKSDYTMKQIAAEVNYHKPDAFLIAEDGRDGDMRVTAPLRAEEFGENQDEEIHDQAIQNISDRKTSLDNLGFDSEWDFKYYHDLEKLMYEQTVFNSFEQVCADSVGKVKYVMSHDEIGNWDGTRKIAKLMVPKLDMKLALTEEDCDRAQHLFDLKDDVESIDKARQTVLAQKQQLIAEKLAKMLQCGDLNKYKGKDYHVFADEVLAPLGIMYDSYLFLDKIRNAFDSAFEQNKMGEALTYAIPGPKMVFQGDEKADLTPFRFFREFESIKDEQYLYWEKGYKHGKPALEESKLGNIPYSREGKEKCNGFKALIKDLNELTEQNTAMTKGTVIRENTVKHEVPKVFGIHTKDFENGNELFTVSNLNGNRYPDGCGGDRYYIHFPAGKWVEILNTNDEKYGGTGKFKNNEILTPDNIGQCPVNLNTHSTIIFKRVE